MRPAPHIRLDGSVVAPIGSLRQQIRKATAKTTRPARLSDRFVEALVATLSECPQVAREIAARLGVAR